MASATNEEQGWTKTGMLVLSSRSNEKTLRLATKNMFLFISILLLLTQIPELFSVLICGKSLIENAVYT